MHHALPEPLFETPSGCTRRCPCCGEIEVAFHEAAVTLSEAQLAQFAATVRSAAGQPGACWGWQLRTRTQRQDVTFTLWGDDARELEALLGGALAMLGLSRLLVSTLGAPLGAARPAV